MEWPEGKKKPKTRQLKNLAGAGAMGGAFWGFLFGLLFFVPRPGMAIGAGMGALTGSLADVGTTTPLSIRFAPGYARDICAVRDDLGRRHR